MSTAARLVKLVEGLDADGVLSATKGGTGNTTGGGTSSPTISQIAYSGDDTAANPAGGQTITLTGTNFAAGAKVLINTTQVSVVTVVSATQITFTAPALAAGSYILYVVNTNGSTAIAVPGIQVSGTPAWTTAAGTLGSVYETAPVSATVAATSDSAVSYSLASGTLPTGATLAANGTISGTSVLTNSSTTYTFTIKATDAENQDTDRSFSLTINPDVVSWSSPANAAALTGAPGVAYSSALVATSAAGKSITYSADSLPAGLSISGATITGTPTTAGTSSSTLTATAATTNRTAQVTISWTITVAADTYFPYTTLLLNSEPTATPFVVDASTNNFSLTVAGDAKPSNFNPHTPGYYSNYFDGSGDSLTAPASTAWNFTGDWTFECWINPNSITGFQTFLGQWGDTSSVFIWKMNSSGRMYLENLSTAITATSTTIVANQWQHIALTRSSNTIRMFVNGVLDATTATRTGTYYSSGLMRVGASGVNEPFAGYISNMRVVNGTALYTTNFTPATTPLTAVAGTSLLTCQSNRFLDTSTNNFTITKVGDVKVSSFDPFVPNTSYATYGSTYFDGTGDYLTVPSNAALGFGTGDYTMESWVYSSAGGGRLFEFSSDSDNIDLNTSTGTVNYYNGSSSTTSTGGLVNNNTWSHIAVVRLSGTVKVYVNGVLAVTQASTPNTSTRTLYIGGVTNSLYNGYISNVRIVKGTAVYTGNFTPPAAPLTAVAGTSLLTCQTNQPHNNQTFLDNSSSAFPITRSGNATQGSFSPYGANWSNYFDGAATGYIQTPASSTTAILGTAGITPTATFTIECWVYQTQRHTALVNPILIGDQGTNGSLYWTFGPDSTGKLAFYHYTGTTLSATGNDTIPLNTWTHIAVSISSGAIKLFVNGNLQTITGTSTTGSQSGSFGYLLTGGFYTFTGGYSYIGYVSNLRIVKSALYTATFTPSTTPLTAVNNTGLLMCQSPSITDNSLNALALTAGNTLSTQKFNPFAVVTQTPNTYSVYFGTKTDYVSIPATTALTTYTGDFTFECWVNPTDTSLTSSWSIWDSRQSGGTPNAMVFSLVDLASPVTGQWRISYYNGTSYYGTGIVNVNQWSHIAFVRSGSTMTFYVNGVAGGTATISGTQAGTATTNPVWIGTKDNGIGTFGTVGYISNFRIVNGTAVYTANFTPATTPLTAIANTQLLTCQDARFVDNSTNAYTLTAGSATTTPRQQNPFGSTTSSTQDYSTTTFGGSGYFDGSNDYLTCTGAISLTGAFTAQGWFYNTSTSGQQQSLFSFNSLNSAYGSIRVDCDNSNIQYNFTVTFSTSGSSWTSVFSTNNAYVKNIWNHFAITRDSANLVKIFINGVQIASGTQAGTLYNTSTTHAIGCNSLPGAIQNPFIGYISDLQLVNGTALYTANFVPPSAPLTAVTNTTLLLNMDKSAIADKSGKVVLETVGDAKISTAVKKYGSSSMYFDGTGDYLNIPTNVAFNFGTGDFTIEAWVYPAQLTTDWFIISASGTGGLFFGYAPSTAGYGWGRAGVAWDYQPATSKTLNAWQHVAISRSGTSMRIFVDGVQQGTTQTNSIAYNLGITSTTIGSQGSNYVMTGYIDDLRITRYARYTTNFTPPTQALITK